MVAGEELFESLTHFVVIHNGQPSDRAERIADQAVAFVVAAATAVVPMVPSDDVDLGLHALILHTKEYADLCQRFAGRFLHHNPKPGGGRRDPERVAASAHAMKAAGFMVFDDLWTVDCTRPRTRRRRAASARLRRLRVRRVGAGHLELPTVARRTWSLRALEALP